MLEHLPQLNITQAELTPPVADYFDNLLAQRDAILTSYDLTPETAEEFCDLHSSDEDREKILALYGKMVYVIEHKKIPPSEVLEKERIQEQQRIDDFFGKDVHIEVPPLPPTITPERIEQWKQKRFELRYLPPLILKEDDDYPGWKKKPINNINLFDRLDQIQNLPENQSNPHLNHLAPNQLPGCWMLVDMRRKPNHIKYGAQIYENDEGIQAIIQKLTQRKIVNEDAGMGNRNKIDPMVFENSDFWKPFYDYLGIMEAEADMRLPRVIEQNIFGQNEDWDETSTSEWAEEYFEIGERFISGDSDYGGASCVSRNSCSNIFIGFRCVAVFASP